LNTDDPSTSELNAHSDLQKIYNVKCSEHHMANYMYITFGTKGWI